MDDEYIREDRNAKLTSIKLVKELRGYIDCGFVSSVIFGKIPCNIFNLMLHWVSGLQKDLSF